MGLLKRLKSLFTTKSKRVTTQLPQPPTYVRQTVLSYESDIEFGNIEPELSLFYVQIEIVYVDASNSSGKTSRGYTIAVAGKEVVDVVNSLQGLSEVIQSMFPDSTILQVKINQISNQSLPFYNGKTLGNFRGKL